jgi:ribonuclease HIII
MDDHTLCKINSMVRALGALSFTHVNEMDDTEYNSIVDSIKHYIMKHCIHDKVYDSVDIDPETSKTICYCKNCHETFSYP